MSRLLYRGGGGLYTDSKGTTKAGTRTPEMCQLIAMLDQVLGTSVRI